MKSWTADEFVENCPSRENDMRKLILTGLMAAVAIPAALSAQTHEIHKGEMKVEARHQELQEAIRTGDPEAIEEQARHERKARQELREDRNQYARDQYVAPYRDWNRESVEPGSKLRSRFYASRYSVRDPDSYQLTRARRNQRWVRYGDDLVLVNLRNGRVVEVASGRF
jgi:Ni/Co efflux regulator RcnB